MGPLPSPCQVCYSIIIWIFACEATASLWAHLFQSLRSEAGFCTMLVQTQNKTHFWAGSTHAMLSSCVRLLSTAFISPFSHTRATVFPSTPCFHNLKPEKMSRRALVPGKKKQTSAFLTSDKRSDLSTLSHCLNGSVYLHASLTAFWGTANPFGIQPSESLLWHILSLKILES